MACRDPQLPSCSAPSDRVCDLLAGTFLFLCTAAFVLWQNTHVTVLWDLSYILENATRISLGQTPYRDFPFPYAPLTFLAQATIIKLFGRVVLHHYLYAALCGGLATLVTWRILLRLVAGSALPARLTAFLLAVPMIFLGTNSIFPHPFYDSDCTFFLLFCIWLLLRMERRNFPAIATVFCGVCFAVPLFIKQNTGLAFFLSAGVCIVFFGIRKRRAAALLLAGMAGGVIIGLGLIQYTAGVGNYLHWTIQFASSRRLPGISTVLGVYRDPELIWIFALFAAGLALLLLYPIAHGLLQRVTGWLGALLLSLPFLWALAALFLEENASDRVEALLRLWPVVLVASFVLGLWQLRHSVTIAQTIPFILLGAIHGAFLSQQLWGSTYALWPLLMILIATILIAVAGPEKNDVDSSRKSATLPIMALTGIISLVLLGTGGYYALSHERLEYADLSGETLLHSKLPALRGLAMRGEWLADFEELVAYTDREIPRGDAILMLPGEDLFYFTTGRTPRFPVVMLDNTVNPYSAEQIAELARQRNVDWLVVKRNLQLQEEPLAFRRQLVELLSRDFEATESLDNYDIYRRKQK